MPKSKSKFKPKCLKGEIQTAYTNRGHLIPCCYCDEPWALREPSLKALTAVSKVSEAKNIEEIVLSKPWQKFAKDLKEENWKDIPKVCKHHCIDRGDDNIKTETYLYKGKKVGGNKV